MPDLRRVYHPTLNDYKDIPERDVDSWAEAGWRKTAPAHFDPSIAPRIVKDGDAEKTAKK